MIAMSLVLLLASLVAGCAQPVVWTKPGATQEGFARDSFTCERDARMMAGANRPVGVGMFGTELAFAQDSRTFYVRCMQSRGYQQRANQ